MSRRTIAFQSCCNQFLQVCGCIFYTYIRSLVIALHRCLDGTVPWLNAGLICGKWLSRMLQHPGRSHCLFMVCFLAKPKRLLGVWQHTCHITRSHPPSSRSTRHSLRPVVPVRVCNRRQGYCPAAVLAAVTASLRTRILSGSGRHLTGKGLFFFASASSFCNSLIFSSNL